MEPASGRELATTPYDVTNTREQQVAREEIRERVPTIVEHVPVATKRVNQDATLPARETGTLSVEPWIEPAGSAPPPRVDHAEPKHSLPRPSWLLVASALLCVGLIVWWFTAQRAPGVDPQRVIEGQLLAAQKAAGEGHYADPYEGSALHYYSTVLTIDESNPQALAGLRRLADQLMTSARAHLDAGRYADAVVALNGARRIDPTHHGLASVEGDLRRELQSLAVRTPASPAAKETASLASTMTAAEATVAKPASAAKRTEPEKLASAPVRIPEASSSASGSAPQIAEASRQAPPSTQARAPVKEAAAASIPAQETATLAAAAAVANGIPPAGASADFTGSANPVSSGSASPLTAGEPEATPEVTTAASNLPAKKPEALLPPIVKYVPPEYPDEARMRGIEGWADLTFLVGANGDVVDPRVENSSRRQLFGRPALSAVKKWRYEPPSAGHPSLTERTKVRIEFQLER